MSYFTDKEIEASKAVMQALDMPLPETQEDCGQEGLFDPWEIFPVFYGSYSSKFDDMAIEVLSNMQNKEFGPESLAHEMFREYLCRVNLCDYGTSPRGCFPTSSFQPLLPALIEKWKAYSKVWWNE